MTFFLFFETYLKKRRNKISDSKEFKSCNYKFFKTFYSFAQQARTFLLFLKRQKRSRFFAVWSFLYWGGHFFEGFIHFI